MLSIYSINMAGDSVVDILIVDDNEPFRQRLKTFLSAFPDLKVAGEATDGLEALSIARELKPKIVLMDLKMKRANGLYAARQLKKEFPEIQIIILTRYDLEAYREAAAAAGASAYVVKKDLVDQLIPTIRRLL